MNRVESDSRFRRLSGRSGGGLFELDGWDVAERLVQPVVVKPADVLHDRELEL